MVLDSAREPISQSVFPSRIARARKTFRATPCGLLPLKNRELQSDAVVRNNVRDLRDRDANPAISCAENIKAAFSFAAAAAAAAVAAAGRRFYFCRLFAAAKLGAAGEN